MRAGQSVFMAASYISISYAKRLIHLSNWKNHVYIFLEHIAPFSLEESYKAKTTVLAKQLKSVNC